MEAIIPASAGERVLYIRTGTGVLGPYPYESVKEMAMSGALPPEGALSTDGHSWVRADKVLEVNWAYRADRSRRNPAAAKVVPNSGYRSSEALRVLLEQVCRSTLPRRLFTVPLMLIISLTLLGVTLSGIGYGLGLAHAVTMKRVIIFMAFCIPSALALLALMVAGGNAFLRTSFGLCETDRRFLALHLPRSVLSRLGWGLFMRNWLFRGEWLFSPSEESSRAYIHLFRSGPSLAGTGDEVALWDNLGRVLPYSLRELCIPGEAIRQVQQVKELPSWSERISEVTDGYALGVVLDHNYVEWARGFLARARKRLTMRGKKALEFVLAYVEMEDGSKVLAVSVYPQVKATTADLAAIQGTGVIEGVETISDPPGGETVAA